MKRPRSPSRRPEKYSRWRAATLASVYGLMTLHVLHWKLAGKTLAPLELNEVMYTLELGIVTAGFLFMALAILATLVFGRFFCSWGCHFLALEDLCTWILGKLRIRPKPVRSRVLLWVPVIAMLYMFAWPQVSRLAAGEQMPALHVRADAQGWASFATTNFWRNLPGPGITLLTFAVCGFVVVYFLGSRAFCTYACPYGAVFSLADRIAPGRIVAKKDCSQCGICTATCQSRVRVHEEVAAFGRVVNPACLKDLDCIAVCPNDALGYGFALPALFEGSKSSRMAPKRYDFTSGEDLLIGAVSLASLFIFRGLYYSVPFLLTLAIGGILGYGLVLAIRLVHLNHVKFNNFHLKIAGRITQAGRVFVAGSAVAGLFTVHSALIRYHEFRGDRNYQVATSADPCVTENVHDNAIQALGHLEFCDRWGLFRPAELSHRLATLHASVGRSLADRDNFTEAIDHLQNACLAEPDVASHHYNLGVLLARTGQSQAALAQYGFAVSMDPTDPEIHNNLGFLLAQKGALDAASEHFRQAITLKPDFAHPHFNLGRILEIRGLPIEASRQFELAVQFDPRYREVLSVPQSAATPTTGDQGSKSPQGVPP